MGDQIVDSWGEPTRLKTSRDLNLFQVKALGRNARWRSGAGECYCYFRPEGGEPSGFWFFSIHTDGWRRVMDERELPESPWRHDPLCDCGQCTESQAVEPKSSPAQRGD